MLNDLINDITEKLLITALGNLKRGAQAKVWLEKEPATLALKKALTRTYSAFARQYPEYSDLFFSASFFNTATLSEISKLLTSNQHPDPALLAQTLEGSLGKKFTINILKPVSFFIEGLGAEIRAEAALQPFFDSRTLDALPKIEAEIQTLSMDLQRGLDTALKTADKYKNITLRIGGDVANSNIIVGEHNTINKYYYAGEFVSLNEYYIPPDGVFQRVQVEEFVGRDWLTAKVDAFLNDPNRKSGAFLLIGDAGVGKTSFMAHLVKERRYLHLFAEQAPGQAMLQRAMQSLGSQLVTRYQIDLYKDRNTLNALSIYPDFLERIMRLAADTLTHDEKIVIVCDALDEAGVFPDQFVFGLPKELPDGVYLILSQRPVNVSLPNFEPVIEHIEAQGEKNLQDMEAYLSAVAKRAEVAGQIRSKEYSEEFFIQTLKEKSQGVWMYLHYIIKEIESGARAPLDLANLPTGLVGYYAEYWDAWRTGKRGKGVEVWDELYAPLLTTLAAAQDAIPMEWLLRWAGVNRKPREVSRLLNESWRAFISEKEVHGKKVFTPYHLSFKDFITGKVDTNKLPPVQAHLIKDLSSQTLEAHARITEIFEEECTGNWKFLVDQDYQRLHLASHLASAGKYEILRSLLTEGNEKIEWAVAREKKEGAFAGYLSDLSFLWSYTDQKCELPLAVRCMLIENSIHSLASNISPNLLAELLKAGYWDLPKCLITIAQQSDPSQQYSSIELIISHVPRDQFREIIQTAHNIKDDYYCSLALLAILPHLGDSLKTEITQEIPILANRIQSEATRLQVLAKLVPFLEGEAQRKLASTIATYTPAIFNQQAQSSILSKVFLHLSNEQSDQAVETICQMNDVSAFVNSILTIAPSLRPAQIDRILLNLKGTKSETYSAGAIHALAPYLRGRQLSAAFEIADKIKGENALALNSLVPHLNKSKLKQALRSVRAIRHDLSFIYSLLNIRPYLEKVEAQKVLAEAFKEAHRIHDEYTRIQAYLEILPHLRKKDKRNLLDNTTTLLHKITNEIAFANILLDFPIPSLPQSEVEKLLDHSCQILDDTARIRAFIALTPNLTEEQLDKILIHLGQLNEENIPALPLILNRMSNAQKSTVLDSVLSVGDSILRAKALTGLIPVLEKELKLRAISESIAASMEINDENARAGIFVKAAPYFKSQKSPEALKLLPFIKNWNTKPQVLAALYNAFEPEEKKKIFDLIISTSDDQIVAKSLMLIDRDVWQSEKAIILRKFGRDGNEAARLQVSTEYYKAFSEADLQSELHRLYHVKDVVLNSKHIIALVPHMSGRLKRQALNVTNNIKDLFIRAQTLIGIAPYYKGNEKSGIISRLMDLIDTIPDESTQANLLSISIAILPKIQRSRVADIALKKISTIRDDFSRARAISDYASHTGELFEQAFALATAIQNKDARAGALASLSRYCDRKTIKEIQHAVNQMTNRFLRPSTLLTLSPHLEETVRISTYCEILHTYEFDFQLAELMTKWEEIRFTGLKDQIIPFLRMSARRKRDEGIEILGILLPAFRTIFGDPIVEDLFKSITDVTRWWP